VEQLTKEFLAESQEGLDRMEVCLTELELHPDDGELVSEIFRTVHTVKGTTGFLGFRRMQTLAHAGESLLGELRDKRLKVDSKLIDGLLKLMDGLRAILSLIAATGTEGERDEDDDSDLIAQLAQLRADGANPTEVLKSPEQVPEQAVPLPDDTLKGSVEAGERDRAQRVENPQRGEARRAGEETTRGTAAGGAGAGQSDPSIRIDVEVLNRMMNQVGELVLTRNQILRSTPEEKNFPELARRLDSVTADLRATVMQARMQPVGHLFSKFPRMVRDLGVTCGRRVRLEFYGQETRLDKGLMEAIRDPLTHAVRNAVDHGIESPSERVRAGKPVEGMLRLRAFQQSGSVVIEVCDDGAGISTEQVLAKAIERGLVTSEQAATMTSREALQLLFVAGFSTAKKITSVSGRGVGMDVVRANMERVGGRVELESREGQGTTVRMRVPLTLAIVPALVVYSGGESFALPQNTLAELVYVSEREAAQMVERIGTTEVFRLREQLLPLVWLDRLLGLNPRPHVEGVGFYIAVVESEGRRFGLAVDDLEAPEEIVVKPLSEELREIGVYSGATVLGSGMLALILNVAAVGARAGVRAVTDEVAMCDGRDGATTGNVLRIGLENAMVIYETARNSGGGAGRIERMAMPLSAVERIESVPIDEIEYAGGRAVLQYRGEVIPLENSGGVLREMALGKETPDDMGDERAKMGIAGLLRTGPQIADATIIDAKIASPRAMATVLICLRPEARGERRVGIIVQRVLDVSASTMLAKDAAACPAQLAMVNQRVTMVYREFSRPAAVTPMDNLKEVA
jgi:two-component system chemotaxis sensor kinase CheA